MGFLDALTADAYPRDSQGRRVFAPYGLRGKAYILPPERAAQIAQVQRRVFLSYFVALLFAGVAIGPWAVVGVGVVSIAGVVVGVAYATRGLEQSQERPSISRDERVNQGLRAMGRPTMFAICFGGAAFAVAGISLLLRGERNVAVWFITLYGALVAVLYGRRLGTLRAVPPAT
jgi:membrane protein implicated in regulation of membrane protease activity